MDREELIEKARELLACGALSKDAADAIKRDFPELAESEDERIRKEIHDFILNLDGSLLSEGHEKRWLAWLEKQKDSLHIPETCKENPDSFTDEDEKIRKWIIELLHKLHYNQTAQPMALKAIEWLEKHKSQDTVGRVSVEIRSNLQTDEVVRKTLIMLVNDGRISVTGAITSSDILDWLEKQKEPDWNKKPCLTCQEYEKGFKQGHLEGCTAGYNMAMKEAEQKEQQPIVIQVENPNIQKLDPNVIIETRTNGTGEPYREPIPGVKKVF